MMWSMSGGKGCVPVQYKFLDCICIRPYCNKDGIRYPITFFKWPCLPLETWSNCLPLRY